MRKRFFRSFFIALIGFILLYGWTIYYYNNEKSQQVLGEGLSSNDELTFLMLGVDSKNVKKDSKVRSDTMMLCKLNKSSGQISILSIPRDTRTKIRGRKNQEKINHAHAYGGPELAVETVRDLLDIDLEYYVVVDYKLVEDYVDLIGGVEIEVPMDMKYEDPTADPPLYIDLKEGQQVLNGDKSLQFLRFRKGYADQDLGRIKAQQNFMKAMIKQSLKFKNIIKAPLMAKTYYKNVETNMSMNLVIKFGLKGKNYDLENMITKTLPGKPKTIEGISYFIYNLEESQKLIKDIF